MRDSARRWSSWLRLFTSFLANPVTFQHKRERLVVLQGPLFGRESQAGFHEAEVKTCLLSLRHCGIFQCFHTWNRVRWPSNVKRRETEVVRDSERKCRVGSIPTLGTNRP